VTSVTVPYDFILFAIPGTVVPGGASTILNLGPPKGGPIFFSEIAGIKSCAWAYRFSTTNPELRPRGPK
jgi:hypothetical protein